MADMSSSPSAGGRKGAALLRSRSQLQSLPYPDRFFVAASYVGLERAQGGKGNLEQEGCHGPGLSEETNLLLYALYQQATAGPCKDPKPRAWNLADQAKWTSWQQLKDMAPTEAMRLFVRTLEEDDADWYLKAEQQLCLSPESSQGSADLVRAAPGPDQVGQLDDQGLAAWQHQGPDSVSPVQEPVARTAGGSNSNGTGVANGSPRKSQQQKHASGAGIHALAVLGEWTSVSCSGHKPPGRYQHAAAVVDDKLFVVGGNHNGRFLSDVQVLDLNNLKWTKVDNKRSTASLSSLADAQDWLPACAGHSLIRDGGRLLSVAGHSKGTSESVLVHAFDLYTQSWSLVPAFGAAPVARGGQTVTKLDSTLVMFGGEDSKRRLLNDVNLLDLETMTWDVVKTTGQPPSPRSGHCAALLVDRYLLIFGGGSHSRCFNDLHVLDLQTMEWSGAQTQGSLPTARAGHAGLVIGNNWYIIGGGDNKSGIPETMVLNMATLTWSFVAKVEAVSSIASEGLSVVGIHEGDEVIILAYGGYNGRFSTDVHLLKISQPVKPKPKLIQSPSAAAAAASAASAVAAKNLNNGQQSSFSSVDVSVTALQMVQSTSQEETGSSVAKAKHVGGEEELLAARGEILKLKLELAEVRSGAADLKEQLLSVRSQFEAEQSRCFMLEVEVAELRQTLKAVEGLQSELNLLQRQKAAEEAAANELRPQKRASGVWGWLAGDDKTET